MREKPVVPPQECDPSTLGIARKPRPAGKRKPQTEVVVQLGPFTDGQITAPELLRPLEGPTEWLIKPRTGEIVPFDSASPPEKDIIRKYITIGAQDNDVPDDLPKVSDGYVVERVDPVIIPGTDADPQDPITNTIRVVENGGPSSVDCKPEPPPPPTPVDPNEGEGEDEECECPPPPKCPPVDEQETCETPVDAENDCASTDKGCPVVIDVLKNDIGCGELNITKASAENGTVEIRDGKLHYQPREGFQGEDVISYTIGDESSLTDTAFAFVKVGETGYTGSPSDCPPEEAPPYTPPSADCPTPSPSDDGKTDMRDHEYSSSPYDKEDQLFQEAEEKLQLLLDRAQSITEVKSSWSTSFSSGSADTSACVPAEEPIAVC